MIKSFSVAMVDFRSIELCLLAHFSGDHKLISVLNNSTKSGKDIFKSLASEWYLKKSMDYIIMLILQFSMCVILA